MLCAKIFLVIVLNCVCVFFGQGSESLFRFQFLLSCKILILALYDRMSIQLILLDVLTTADTLYIVS